MKPFRSAIRAPVSLETALDVFARPGGDAPVLAGGQGQFTRLSRKEVALVQRWPDATHHPLLFGVLVGVKNIFYADGFKTRSSSLLASDILMGSRGRERDGIEDGRNVVTGNSYARLEKGLDFSRRGNAVTE